MGGCWCRYSCSTKWKNQGCRMGRFQKSSPVPTFHCNDWGYGVCGCILCRSLTRNVDVSWQKEQTPQNALSGKQFKMFNPRGIEYEKLEKPPSILKRKKYPKSSFT